MAMALLNPVLALHVFSVLSILSLITRICTALIYSPLSSIQGPRLFALTEWRLALEEYRGTRTTYIQALHNRYGAVVRIGPNEISFNSLSALRTIYGAGTVFQRNDFYRMFDVYGRPCMFSMAGAKEHRERKRLLNHAYSKTSILSSVNASMIEEKTKQFIDLVAREADAAGNLEIFYPLHYFSLDSITAFLYGKNRGQNGATTALAASSPHRSLLDDIIDPARRRLSWFTIHLPQLTSWLYTRAGLFESLLTFLNLLPMRKPSTYTGIRAHALKAAQGINQSVTETGAINPNESITERLLHAMQNGGKKEQSVMDILDVASECADHLLAGIDTTSDTIMWAIFLLSQPENKIYQKKLRAEIQSQSLQEQTRRQGWCRQRLAADKIPYLEAVIKETLRLFAPLPGTEPRVADTDQVIDGHLIPAGTVVSISPYMMHRNPTVFRDPERFDPERWLKGEKELAEMNRWFWAFSSGGRMCIGLHLAMAEMTTLLASVYKVYETEITPGFRGTSPGVTARYELFSDERFRRMEEHTCWVRFVGA